MKPRCFRNAQFDSYILITHTIIINILKQNVRNNNKTDIELYNILWKRRYLFGTGAVNAIIAGRWCKTPAMNSSPTVDIPYREVSSGALKTFSPFWSKLICTWDPEPMSSKAYLAIKKRTQCNNQNSIFDLIDTYKILRKGVLLWIITKKILKTWSH